jgi:5-methylcytosine-specific restriction protein A
MPGHWRGSNRSARLPSDWASRIVPLVFATYGDHCHVCGQPGADEVDHVRAGDDHSLTNLRPIHGRGTPQRCHARKSSAEGNAARWKVRQRREPERHPGLLP